MKVFLPSKRFSPNSLHSSPIFNVPPPSSELTSTTLPAAPPLPLPLSSSPSCLPPTFTLLSTPPNPFSSPFPPPRCSPPPPLSGSPPPSPTSSPPSPPPLPPSNPALPPSPSHPLLLSSPPIFNDPPPLPPLLKE